MPDHLVASRAFIRASLLTAVTASIGFAQQPTRATATPAAAHKADVKSLGAGTGSKYLFAWTGDSARKASDFLAVIDADPTSKSYGHVLTSVAANAVGTGPHHTEYEFPNDGMLIANGFAGNKSFVFDLRRPTAPTLTRSFSALGAFAFPHSFARLPNGHVLATTQGRNGVYAPPGALVELDERGNAVRSSSAAGHGLADTLAWPYSLAVDAKHDRAVITISTMLLPPWVHAPAGSWKKARADSVLTDEIEVWRLSDLKLLNVIHLPKPPHAKVTDGYTLNDFPAEPRLLPDGSMYVNTFTCGLYHVTAIESATPRVELVHEFPTASGMSCAVPAIVGRYWVQTVPALPGLIALDISNPAHPVEVSRLVLDKRLGMVHWLAADANANRVVMTSPDKGYVTIVNVDPRTGALAIDTRFRDERTGAVGVNLDGRRWPQGEIALTLVHGTLFGPR